MPILTFDPPLQTIPTTSPADASFLQTVQLLEATTPLGLARWHARPACRGIVQLLDFAIEPAHRRRGLGRLLLDGTITSAADYCRVRNAPLRRMWVVVEQKQQVIARAFLVANGFQHVGTLSNLLREEDALIYARAFD